MTPNQLAREMIQDTIDMYNIGMPNKTIVSNINAMLEPVLGFSGALDASDLIDKSLKKLRANDQLTFSQLLGTIKKIKKDKTK